MITTGPFVQALHTLIKTSELSGKKNKMQLLKMFESDELKYLLWVANCQFVVTHLSTIDIEDRDPLQMLNSDLHKSVSAGGSGKDFTFFKNLIELLMGCKSANGEIRETVSNFINHFEPECQKVLTDVLTKRLKLGVSTSSINKIWPNLIAAPSVMLATDDFMSTVKDWPIEDVVLNEKFDGVRVIANILDGDVQYYSRNFNEFSSSYLPKITKALLQLAAKYREETEYTGSIFFDGELTPTDAAIAREIRRAESKDEAGVSGIAGNIATESRKKISGNLTRMLRGTYKGNDDDFMFNCFDAVEYSGNIFQPKLSTKILRSRLDTLDYVFAHLSFPNITLVKVYTITSFDDIVAIYEKLLSEGKEGVIAKLATAPYEMRRSSSWQKLKATKTMDLRIVAVELGNPGTVNEHRLGNFVCQDDEGKLEVNVGGGFSHIQRDEFWEIRKELIGKIVEVEYNMIINDRTGMRSLFLPRFSCIRYDKDVTDVIKS